LKTNNFFLKSIPPTLKVLLGAKVPLRVTQYITERCNLDCIYCGRHESGGQELATDEVKSLMASFRKAGTLFWAFSGGEALLRDDIGDLVNFAKSLGLFVNISTNGTLLARKYREIRNADLINITLEGPKEIHDEMRSKSYDLMNKGVEALARNGIRFTFMTQINNRNMDSLGFILDFAERYQTKVVFPPIRRQKEDSEGKSRVFFPTREKMQQTMDYLLKEKARGRHVASSANFLRQIRDSWPTGRPDMSCWAGKLYCSITPEGAVTACCDTLQATRKKGNGHPPKNAIEDFYLLPDIQCSTCYASTPLEANIAMSTCIKNPLAAIRQVQSFLPRFFWNARR
jgi:MoaA/NifB/PqqE/SkfB family radical SAM enzyme